jgi:DNA-binding NtrC family response regulator
MGITSLARCLIFSGITNFRSASGVVNVMTYVSNLRPCALVVDDDALIRMNSAQILSDAGFRTFEGRNADEALSILANHHASIGLLFTDVQMPGTRNGFALARETAARWPEMQILVASGQSCPEAGDMPEGAIFVCKPFSPAVIHDWLKQLFP